MTELFLNTVFSEDLLWGGEVLYSILHNETLLILSAYVNKQEGTCKLFILTTLLKVWRGKTPSLLLSLLNLEVKLSGHTTV